MERAALARVSEGPVNTGLLRSLLLLAWMVEARDPYTGGHLWRVAHLAELLAEAVGFPPKEVQRIALAAFLHDLGKVGVPDGTLCKQGRLTGDEYLTIQQHAEIGLRLLQPHPLASLVLSVVHHHHERPDGKGYPLGLTGDNIPLDARLVAVCDAFDAMTSCRPYRAGMPVERALDVIEAGLGQQFDAHLGGLFLELGRAGRFSGVVGFCDDGIPLAHCDACGPVLVRDRTAQVGDFTRCPACKAGYRWVLSGASMLAVVDDEGSQHMGWTGSDGSLLDHLVERWAVLL
ncbi:HD-GYP domain-containing protein [Leeia sp.]|uniref:HD-GYP domain-containing protein n=1 Tax=Leeia sp. TaxID=2884678 RepID=UPI0035B1FEE3